MRLDTPSQMPGAITELIAARAAAIPVLAEHRRHYELIKAGMNPNAPEDVALLAPVALRIEIMEAFLDGTAPIVAAAEAFC